MQDIALQQFVVCIDDVLGGRTLHSAGSDYLMVATVKLSTMSDSASSADCATYLEQSASRCYLCRITVILQPSIQNIALSTIFF